MPVTPQDTIDDAERVADDVSEMVQDKIAFAEDELLSFTNRKPLVALLTAVVVGVVLGKLVL